jgi:hypothetical protein
MQAQSMATDEHHLRQRQDCLQSLGRQMDRNEMDDDEGLRQQEFI